MGENGRRERTSDDSVRESVYARAMPAERTPSRKRSIVKALTYRVCILCLDFIVVYVLTHKAEIAVGFMIVSNIYTTIGYIVHERVWANIRWGLTTTTVAADPKPD